MYTRRFASLDEFFTAVRSETRHFRHVTDELLQWPITEYQLWLSDNSPKKPFEVELPMFLESCARGYRRPKPAKPPAYWEPPGEPPEWQKQLFELFGIDWRPERVAKEGKSA